MNRRGFLKATSCALVPYTLGNALLAQNVAAASSSIDLTIAGYPFEHIRRLMTGKVKIEGCDVQYQVGKIGDLNTHVFSGPRTLDVTEIGLIPFILAYANDDFRAYSLVPVFPLRMFRHRSIFVRSDSGINQPADLKGKRVGTPGYSSTSLTWIRGMLHDEYGVRPEDIQWVVSAKDSSTKDAGKISKQENVIPDGISISVGPEGKDESDLLIDREVDALFHAAEPRAFIERHPKVTRLFKNVRRTEQDYYAKTGVFPIMHAVAIRNSLVEEHPWLPRAVFNAYSESKAQAYADMQEKWFLRTLPWFAQELDTTQALMGRNFFTYGIAPNRKTLEALLRYAHEQGLARRKLAIEDLFEPSTLGLIDHKD
ncbi:MAG: ABC transporter substrate-binding protein [Betaproteobacteria bacterium]|jgi:4,5-dihydroxyphthalate decarboxylase|nr:MAG: ABC transporter substrate-binding protein [Betaproteobacteria bacterium]